VKNTLPPWLITSNNLCVLVLLIGLSCSKNEAPPLPPTEMARINGLLSEAEESYVEAAYDSALVKVENTIANYQTSSSVFSPLLLKLYKLKGDCLLQTEQPDQALALVDSLLELGPPKGKDVIEGSIALANIKAKALDAMGLDLKARMLYDSILMAVAGKEAPLELAWTYEGLGNHHGNNGNLKITDACYEKAFEIRNKYASQDSLQLFRSYYSFGQLLMAQGSFTTAIEQLEKSLAILEAHRGNRIQRASIYWTLASAYKGSLDFARAESYLDQALIDLLSLRAPNHRDIVTLYTTYGDLYNDLKEYDKALSYYDKAMPLLKKQFVSDEISLGMIYHNAGLSYANLSAFDQAETYFKNAVRIFETYNDTELSAQKYLFSAHNKLALLEYFRGNYAGTIKSYLNQIKALEDFYGINSPELLEPLNNLGVTYDEMKQYEQAIKQYSRELDIVGVKPGTASPFENMVFPLSAQYALWNRAESHFSHYIANEKEDFLNKAVTDYQLSVDFLDHMRLAAWEEGSKENFAKENKVVYERSIRINTFLQSEKTDSVILQRAYAAFEKSRSLLLLENFRKNKVSTFANISSETQEKEASLKTTFETVENDLFLELSKAKPDSKKLADLKKRRFQQKELLDNFLADLAKDAPNYYRFKYNIEPLPLTVLQAELRKQNAGLLEYFVHQEGTYALVVLPDSFYIHFLNVKSDLRADVQALRESIYEHWVDPEKSRSEYRPNAERFIKSASNLYQVLIDPIKSLLPEKLIIVPDDILNNLPFEVLLSTVPEDPEAYYDHAYLINDHQISYAYSATTLLEMQNKTRGSTNIPWLGMAPSFSNQAITSVDTSLHTLQQGLQPLKYTSQSITDIAGLLKGKTLLGEKADKRSFLKLAEGARIIHLAGHAEANDVNGELSWVAFTDSFQDGNEVILFAKELYQLDLNAEMVVLSACQSGIGEYQTGEGMISLGRAFSYAGAKSIIHTLWNVEDKASQELNLLFYQNLKKGWGKAKALRQAKLSFIREAGVEGKFDPYFWAGFLAVGDMSPVF